MVLDIALFCDVFFAVKIYTCPPETGTFFFLPHRAQKMCPTRRIFSGFCRFSAHMVRANDILTHFLSLILIQKRTTVKGRGEIAFLKLRRPCPPRAYIPAYAAGYARFFNRPRIFLRGIVLPPPHAFNHGGAIFFVTIFRRGKSAAPARLPLFTQRGRAVSCMRARVQRRHGGRCFGRSGTKLRAAWGKMRSLSKKIQKIHTVFNTFSRIFRSVSCLARQFYCIM